MDCKKETFSTYLSDFYANGNFEIVFESTLNQVKEENLLHAKKVLSVGSGPGVREIRFMKKRVPNVEKAVFVEPSKNSFEELNKNVASSFGAEVETETYNCNFEDWKMNKDKFDVILMFHSFYYFDQEERKMILKNCLEELSSSEGLIYITIMDHSDNDANKKSIFQSIFNELGLPSKTQMCDLKKDLIFLKREFTQYPFIVNRDFNSISPGFIKFLKYYCIPNKTEEEISEAIESLKKKGFEGSHSDCLCVIKGGKL